jgi:hypothetical protein
VDAVTDNLNDVLSLLEQRADGYFTPGETPKRFPALNDRAAKRAEGLSCWALFEAWVTATKRANATVRRSWGVFLGMEAAFPHTSAGALIPRDAKASFSFYTR